MKLRLLSFSSAMKSKTEGPSKEAEAVEVSEGKAAQASEEEGQTTEAGRATVLSFSGFDCTHMTRALAWTSLKSMNRCLS